MSDPMPLAYFPPPPGFNYVAAIEPCYTFVLISLPLSAILVPILFLILFFSTSSSRRTLLFSVNVLIVLLGILEGVLSTVVQSFVILRPQKIVDDRLFITYISLAFYTPIIVDCVLILRLSAVYPSTLTTHTTRRAILSVPLLCSVARFAVISLFVRQWAITGQKSTAFMAGETVWPQNHMVITDWSIQLFENVYCSTLFLFRLRGHKAFSSRMYRHQTIAARLQALFYVAVSNFVFPTFFSVVQLYYIIRDSSVIHGATVLMVNNYVSIIGVLFSTLWCCSDVWKGHNINPSFSSNFPQSIVTLSGIAPNLTLGPSESRSPQNNTTLPHGYASSNFISYGHRQHPYVDGSQPFDEANRKEFGPESESSVPHASKECDSTSFLQPISLPRRMSFADVDEESSESPNRSPITPCDIPQRNEVAKAWLDEARGEPCNEHYRAGISEAGSHVDLEIEFATPTPPPTDALGRRRRRHSLSISAGTPELFASSLLEIPPSRLPTESSASISEGLHGSVHVGRRSPYNAQRASFLEWSDVEPGSHTRTPSCGGRSL